MNRTLSFRELRLDISSKPPEDEDEQHANANKGASVREMPPDPGYDYHMQKNYKFALTSAFVRDKKKTSEFVDTSSAHTGYQMNSTDVQVFEMIPVDYLDKMSDEKADLKTWLPLAALGFCQLTQAIIQPIDHFLREKLKVFCPFPMFSSTLRGGLEDNIDFDPFYNAVGCTAWRPGS